MYLAFNSITWEVEVENFVGTYEVSLGYLRRAGGNLKIRSFVTKTLPGYHFRHQRPRYGNPTT